MAKKKAKGNLKVSLSELSQEINLKDYLGRKPTASEKKHFADLVVDTIQNRTLDTHDINGKKFKKYSKEYADFKGVTRDSVDLFLDGDMLENIGRRKSKEKSGSVFIQMKKGLQTKKGYNHNVGDTLAKREFFGVTDAEAKKISSEIRDKKADKPSTLSLLTTKKAVEETTQSGTSLAELRAALELLDIEQVE
tara:strand:- start:101 stop:679 length:579 start_codon:yes stop_codon:yes gene_type:complete